ncbi:DUF1365 domain-containing protein [Uliginosibacterium flavum]|uniref:DUF1365 domain-containing protein n=1 Tax=Uliginosibacterium flavum TaxID=1396831 RepID=A0ABV2TP57_9RHOO
MTPRLLYGSVVHARHATASNAFSYAMFTLWLPLSQLAEAASPLLGIEKFRLFSFFNRDHGARDGSALLPWIRDILQQHGLSEVTDGEVVLQTMPRLFGFVFNPVSFWYCHDKEGGLRVVLAEVSNTFGERHNYLVAHADRRVIGPEDVLVAQKVFHVSPFFPVRGEYHFSFIRRGERLTVALDYFDGGQKQLTTRLISHEQPLTAGNLLRAWLRCPLLTLGVVYRINWQALRLVIKRVQFFTKPQAPREETT